MNEFLPWELGHGGAATERLHRRVSQAQSSQCELLEGREMSRELVEVLYSSGERNEVKVALHASLLSCRFATGNGVDQSSRWPLGCKRKTSLAEHLKIMDFIPSLPQAT